MYLLMHKDIPVLECHFQDGYFERCGAVLHKEHLPIGTSDMFGFSGRYFSDWLGRRPVPRDRLGLNQSLQLFRNPSTSQLMLNNYACNLSDCYWLKPADSEVTWSQVNFFENDFSKTLGDLMLGRSVNLYRGNAIGPDSATNGQLPKAWRCFTDGRRVLLKSSTALGQEPYNELIGFRFCRVAGLKAAKQSVLVDDSHVYSACDCVADKDTELVMAWDILREFGSVTSNPTDTLTQYRQVLCDHGVRYYGLNDMIVMDYLMRNTDRHWSNFGILRDSNTLEWKGIIPFFDFGNSLWYDDMDVTTRQDGRSALTGMSLHEDLRFVSHCSLDNATLSWYEDIVQDVLLHSSVDSKHVKRVFSAVKARTEYVRGYFGLSNQAGKGLQRDVEC